MRSSSTEKRGFWPADRGAWTRLSLVVVVGGGALVAPVVGVTGAVYTDTETVGFDVISGVPPTTTGPTTDATDVPQPEAPAPAALVAPAPAPQAPAAPGDPATPSAPSPASTPDPAPTPAQQTGQGGSRTLWPVWPHHRSDR